MKHEKVKPGPVEVPDSKNGSLEEEAAHGLASKVHSLKAENAVLRSRLAAARELLKSRWEDAQKLAVIFGEDLDGAVEVKGGGSLARFSVLLDHAPRKNIREIAEAAASMGRATRKQVCAAVPYSRPTVYNALAWLVRHDVFTEENGVYEVAR